jgi:hypothetical protein
MQFAESVSPFQLGRYRKVLGLLCHKLHICTRYFENNNLMQIKFKARIAS